MPRRHPEEIIGHDHFLALVAEGYAVVHTNDRLPCDVKLPGVVVTKGCQMGTLLEAIEKRRRWSADEVST